MCCSFFFFDLPHTTVYSFLVKLMTYFIFHLQYLYELGWHARGLIAVTQPRRVSALTLADRVASERGEILGETVGVSVSFIDKYSDATAIKVCVDYH